MTKSKGKAEDVEAAEVSAIEAVTDAFDPVAKLVRGDCRDAMLNVIRSCVDWSKFDEARQRDINAAVNNAAVTITSKVVAAVASEGRETVHAKLEQIVVKDGLKLQLTAEHTHDGLILLAEAQGKYVVLTVADAGAFSGERAPAPVDRDQKELLGDGETADQDLADAGDEVAQAHAAQRAEDAEQFEDGSDGAAAEGASLADA